MAHSRTTVHGYKYPMISLTHTKNVAAPADVSLTSSKSTSSRRVRVFSASLGLTLKNIRLFVHRNLILLLKHLTKMLYLKSRMLIYLLHDVNTMRMINNNNHL